MVLLILPPPPPLHTHKTKHNKNKIPPPPPQGYVLYSERKKLKAELQGRTQAEIRDLRLAGQEVTDTFTVGAGGWLCLEAQLAYMRLLPAGWAAGKAGTACRRAGTLAIVVPLQ